MTDPKATPPARPLARAPRGFPDRDAQDIAGVERMMAVIRKVYESYGYDAVETPFVEYADALGKFLPDQDRPNEGVFAFRDDDGQWLSLRYDLTAPLARHVAENYDRLPKPYRSYRSGWVFRNEKPGPGRFRQFLQFDADIVGSGSVAADAEIAMMAADTLEALGVPRGQYVIKVNDRRILDGVMEAIGLGGPENAGRRLTVLRAIDKLDRLGVDGVSQLLGAGRKDESGDFTKGAGLDEEKTSRVLDLIAGGADSQFDTMRELGDIAAAVGYGSDRIRIDPSVVRGLEYYTGPVFEAELLIETKDEKGQLVRFGSVGGGGRYDGLIGRFRGEDVPATGFSIGVSRLYASLKLIDSPIVTGATPDPLVVVTVMDEDHMADYQAMAAELRAAGLRTDVYLGAGRFGAQMKYADRRGAAVAVIQGADERARGVVQIKDLILGATLSGAKDRADYKALQAQAQFAVPRGGLVAAVREVIARRS